MNSLEYTCKTWLLTDKGKILICRYFPNNYVTHVYIHMKILYLHFLLICADILCLLSFHEEVFHFRMILLQSIYLYLLSFKVFHHLVRNNIILYPKHVELSLSKIHPLSFSARWNGQHDQGMWKLFKMLNR